MWFGRGVSTVLALWLIVACEQIVDADDYGVARPPPWAEPACGECVEQRCGIDDCDEDPACAAYAGCLRSCTPSDHACRRLCHGDHWRDSEAQRSFDSCYRSDCNIACVVPGGYYAPRGEECAVCMRDACAEEYADCILDVACDVSASCVAACTDPNCQMVCVDKAFSASAPCSSTPPLAGAIGLCRNTCREECRFGEDWLCVDDYQWKTASDTVRRAFRVVHFFGGTTPYPGVELDVCDSIDPLCAMPFDSGVAGDDGVACLSFQSVGVGFQGFLGTMDPNDGQQTIYYVRHPVTSLLNADQVILPTAGEVAGVAELLGVGVDPERAQVAVIVYDCSDAPAHGVALEISIDDSDMVAFYPRNNLPTTMASETDDAGLGGWANVPVGMGPVTISARLEKTGEIVADRQVVLRAGAVTIVALSPRPK